ncbi:phosphatase PAP2 family protein [Mycolicibacterium peregrinum]|uniref:phosphatase PAP2 family protein n=1 Tax=Mycolicibacterium peregrinum TaxID=43304 RepID=UPI0012FF6346|nr:phosphatase PAP2 family protein [Mycolicibacterium peregrinum]MCV7206656.1 phosphatase PAP2 family protein [Mycolicibacterium peregrinum]
MTWQVPVAMVLLSGFIGVGFVAHTAHAGSAVDHHVLDWIVARRNPGLTGLATFITDLGSPAAIVLIAVAAAVLIWLRTRAVRPALVVVATVGAASVVSTVGKWVAGSHRPPAAVQLLTETDHSFPSGHVTGTAALLGILAVVAGARGGHTVLLLVAAVVATLIVAATRLYLGVHWLTDVSGGFLLGSAAVLLGWAFLATTADDTPEITKDAAEPTLTR